MQKIPTPVRSDISVTNICPFLAAKSEKTWARARRSIAIPKAKSKSLNLFIPLRTLNSLYCLGITKKLNKKTAARRRSKLTNKGRVKLNIFDTLRNLIGSRPFYFIIQLVDFTSGSFRLADKTPLQSKNSFLTSINM